MAQKGNNILVTNVDSEGPRLLIWGVINIQSLKLVENVISILNSKFLQRHGLPNPQDPNLPDALCCVNYRGNYVRAKIRDIRPNGVIVYLVDSGITEIVPLDVIRLLNRNSPEEDFLCSIPPLANELVLANTVCINEKWESRSIECILGFIKDKEMEVSSYERYNSRFLVNLVYNGQDVGNTLVNKWMAKMATIEEMFKTQSTPASTMYSQQPPYKVNSHQQQMPVPQVSTNGYSGGDHGYHAPPVNQMPIQSNVESANWRLNPSSYVNQPSSYLYQQPHLQQTHHQQPHVQQPAPVSRIAAPQKPDSDDESEPTVFGFRSVPPQMGKLYPAKITFVEDGPCMFSIQLLENRNDLMKLMSGIQAHEATPFREPPLIGAVCLARLKTQSILCRAVVMATSEKQVKIYFVDFGHTECVPHTDIYRLPKKFITEKVLSIRICLTGLKEMNVTEEVKKYFTDLISGQEVNVLICQPEGTLLIQYGELTFNGRNVKDYLKDRFPDIASVTYGRIQPMTDGTKETVFVSFVASCSKFFVHLEKNIQDLDDLMAVIYEYASTAPPVKQVAVNTLCIAPYDVDQQWYRVKILKINGDNVNVLYVDYGNEETVNKNQLRTIRKDLVTQMPCQAIQCVLTGFQSKASNAQLDSHFETLTSEKRLSMTVKSAQSSCLIVDLFDITTTPPKSIVQELDKLTMETPSINNQSSFTKKPNESGVPPTQNHQRFDSKQQPGVAQRQKFKSKAAKNREDTDGNNGSASNPFQTNDDDSSKSKSKSWKDDHNEQRHDNRYQRRDDGDRFNRDSGNDRNGRGNNFNRDNPNRSFNRDGGNDRYNRDGGNDRFNKDGGNDRFNKDGGNKSFNRETENNPFGRDGGNNSFSQDAGNNSFGSDKGNNPFGQGNNSFSKEQGSNFSSRDGGYDKFNRDGGSGKFNHDGGNRYNRDGGNDKFNRDGGNDRYNRDGGNDRYNRDRGNDKFNRDGGNRFNRDGGNDRFNRDGDSGRYNQFDNRGNKFGSNKKDTSFGASDNESVSSKGSGKRGDKGGFQNRKDNRSNNFNKFDNRDNENGGFKSKRFDDNSGSNFKSKFGHDDEFNKTINFDSGVDFSEPKKLEIPLPPVTLGKKNRCELVYLTNLSNFYVHLIPENEKLEELMEKIAEAYEHGGAILESSKVKPNVVCITQYAEDERWYRVIVQSVEGTTAKVLFVDYGNIETVNMDKLKEISEEFTKLPIQAVPCKLFGTKKTEWSDEEITSFGDLTNEKLLEAEFVTKDNEWFQVLLREVENEITKSDIINQTFCPGVDLIKEKESPQRTVSNSANKQSSFDFASSESKWNDKKIESGTKDSVMVTWFDSPQRFYCQALSKQQEFRPMMEEIQKVYVEREPVSDPVEPGNPVIAIFPQDEALYRAEVVEVNPNRNHVVQYVDFGNKATVSQRQMYPVEKRFMTLPKQGIRCSLKDILPPTGDNWTNQNSQEVEKYLFDVDEFQCLFHEKKDDTYLVSLNSNGTDVVDHLVEKKHVLSTTAKLAQTPVEKPTTVKSSANDAPRFDIQLLPGQTLRAKVSSVESVSKFHVQFSSADACNQVISSYMTNNDPKVMPRLSSREMCLGAGCLIFKNGVWRRAVIVNCSEKRGFDVKLIDTGAYVKISQDRVLALPSQLAVMQNQAIECALHNVQPSSSLNEKLKSMVQNKDIMIYVENIDKNRLIVKLYDSLGCEIQLLDMDSKEEIPPVCPMPILSSTHQVNVSCANHSNSLYLQMVSDAEKDQKLHQEMTEFYSTNREKAIPKLNRLCAVESQGSFCRAKITKINSDTVTVNLIDFGMNENVACDKLKVLDSRFHVPHQLAIHVSLNVTVLGAPVEQLKALKPHLIGKEFTATFYNVHKKWIVELVENGVKLSETLTSLKLVKEATTIIPEETEEMLQEEKIQVIISHTDSPAEVWIQRVDEMSKLQEIQAELQKVISSCPAVDKVPEEGSLCAVISEDTWYRAQVIDADEDISTVRFIDYGKTDVINNLPENIKTLPDSIKSKKACGIKCRLDVIPVDSEDWSDSICNWMRNLKTEKNLEAIIIAESAPMRVDLFINGKSVIDTLVEEGKALKVHQDAILVEEIVENELDPRSAFISHIYSPSDFYVQEEKSVSDLEKIQDRFMVAEMLSLVSDVKEGLLCVAKFSDESYYRARVISQGESSTKVLFIDYGNHAEVTEIREIPDDVACIPPLARKCSLQMPYYASQWPNGALESFCELSADGATIFLMDVLKEGEIAIVKLTLENEDIAEKLAPPETAIISNINSPQEFWVQKESILSELEKMQDRLVEAENYSSVEAREGLICAAKFPEDGQWYRAQILSHNENETVVSFIDYGNSSSCTEIRALPEDLANIGYFAIKCRLLLPTYANEWSEDAFDVFCTLSQDGNVAFILNVVEEEEIAIVNLFHEKENIAEKLVSKVAETMEVAAKTAEVVVEKVAVQEKESIPEKETVQEEAPVSVFISQLNSTREFWIQEEKSADKISEVGDLLFSFESNPAVKDPKEGSVYAALFPEDSFWYRAKVISSNETETCVFFIDYGNASSVTELRTLSDDLVNLPPLAKKCSLKLPPDVSEWPENALAEFNKLSADGTAAFMMYILQDGDLAIVDLKLNDESVIDKLLESVPSKQEKQNCELEQKETEKIDSRDEKSVSETTKIVEDSPMDVETSKINGIVEDKIEEDTPAVSSHEVLTPQNDCEISQRLPPEGEEILNMAITNTISPSIFWGQTQSDLSKLQEIVEKRLEDAASFDKLKNIDVGTICAAQFPDDELWYRAKILSRSEDSTEVIYIDFGNSSMTNELRELPEDLMAIEHLANQYSLRKPSEISEWSQEACEKFFELIGDGAIMLQYKILDPETKEIELIYQGNDVVELLTPLCTKVINDGKSENDSQIKEPKFRKIEVIDLTDETDLDDSLVTCKIENEGEKSPDSAYHSEKPADTSSSSRDVESTISKEQEDVSVSDKEPVETEKRVISEVDQVNQTFISDSISQNEPVDLSVNNTKRVNQESEVNNCVTSADSENICSLSVQTEKSLVISEDKQVDQPLISDSISQNKQDGLSVDDIMRSMIHEPVNQNCITPENSENLCIKLTALEITSTENEESENVTEDEKSMEEKTINEDKDTTEDKKTTENEDQTASEGICQTNDELEITIRYENEESSTTEENLPVPTISEEICQTPAKLETTEIIKTQESSTIEENLPVLTISEEICQTPAELETTEIIEIQESSTIEENLPVPTKSEESFLCDLEITKSVKNEESSKEEKNCPVSENQSEKSESTTEEEHVSKYSGLRRRSSAHDEKILPDSVSGNIPETSDKIPIPRLERRRSSAHDEIVVGGFLSGSQPKNDEDKTTQSEPVFVNNKRRKFLPHEKKILASGNNLLTGSESKLSQ